MGWANLTLVTDADLAAIEPQARANTSPPPWGATTWPSARAEAKREIKILIETSFGAAVRNAADHVLDTHRPDYVLSAISGTVADITAAAVDRTEDDIDLTAIYANVGNKLYIGCDYQFDGVFLLMKDARNAQARVLTVKYSGGSGFAAIATAVDGTSLAGVTLGQSGRITWPAVPSDWQRRVVSPTADPLYWVELTLDAALSSGSTKAAEILTIRPPDGLRRVAALLALYYVLNGLERQAAKPKDWQEKAVGYRHEAIALFQLLKEQGGIPLDVNRDNVITAAEVVTTHPVRLRRG